MSSRVSVDAIMMEPTSGPDCTEPGVRIEAAADDGCVHSTFLLSFGGLLKGH